MPATTSLTTLMRAIGRLDAKAAEEYRDSTPALARESLRAGATRGESKSWYFERIEHYAYAIVAAPNHCITPPMAFPGPTHGTPRPKSQ
jgi:hypothetical protein